MRKTPDTRSAVGRLFRLGCAKEQVDSASRSNPQVRNHAMSDFVDTLKSLHTALVDSRNGYEEGLKDAEGKGLTPLFHEMIDLRNRHHTELDRHLRAAGEEPDEKGSSMSTVHRTVMKVRSVLTGLDESALSGLVDGAAHRELLR